VIRVAIVDDEPVAREGLRLWLATEPGLEIVGEAGSVGEAVALVRHERPDLLLLDVQMPGGDGFRVLEDVAGEHLPEVVFVTAHERHALQAFEVAALDFLLKPVQETRFRAAIARARAALAGGDESGPARVSALLGEVRRAEGSAPAAAPERFVVRHRDRWILVPAADVDWIGAAGNYSELHTAGGTHLVRSTLAELESRLDGAGFVRIHRGTLVRSSRIREIVSATHGDCDVVMHDGTVLKLSRRYRDRLLGGA
jgi:two-component system LytT family response regulator